MTTDEAETLVKYQNYFKRSIRSSMTKDKESDFKTHFDREVERVSTEQNIEFEEAYQKVLGSDTMQT